MCRLALVDDHVLVRESLTVLLDSHSRFQVVAQASGEAILPLLSGLSCHLVILSVHPELENPNLLVREIKRRHQQLPILLLSQGNDHGSIFDSLEAGANGCVPKWASTAEFLEAVKEVAAGGSYLHPFIAQSVIGRLRSRQTASEPPVLTPREQEILALLAQGRNNEQIARELHLSLSTVKSHLRTAYRKLGAGDRTQAVLQALKLKVIEHPRA